jgi:uncharacterized membrane protein YhhN
MTTAAWALLAATLAVALVDWWATWTERRPVRLVAKPATLVLLIAVALALDPVDERIRTWMVIGLVLSLAGDAFLLFEQRFFVPGLVSFLLGHLAYIVGLQLAPTSVAGSVAGLAVVALAVATVGRRIVAGVRAGDHPELTVPVVVYLLVISAMVVSAFGTLAPAAIVGSVLFYASDATLAWNRFLRPLRYGGPAVMVTYHLGQIGLVAWLVAP